MIDTFASGSQPQSCATCSSPLGRAGTFCSPEGKGIAFCRKGKGLTTEALSLGARGGISRGGDPHYQALS